MGNSPNAEPNQKTTVAPPTHPPTHPTRQTTRRVIPDLATILMPSIYPPSGRSDEAPLWGRGTSPRHGSDRREGPTRMRCGCCRKPDAPAVRRSAASRTRTPAQRGATFRSDRASRNDGSPSLLPLIVCQLTYAPQPKGRDEGVSSLREDCVQIEPSCGEDKGGKAHKRTRPQRR